MIPVRIAEVITVIMINKKKLDLIFAVHEMLKTTSPELIKIRDVAAAANCNSAIIYRHFDNLDHLILIASIKFLEDYLFDLQDVTRNNTDPLEVEITTWRIFAKYAFMHIEVFDLLFWGKYKENLGDSIYEYYKMFPEQWQHLNGLYTIVFFNNDLQERNRVILDQAANAGYFKPSDVPLLANLQCCFLHGMMMDYKNTYRQPGVPEKAAALFMETLLSLQKRYRLK